MKSFVAKVEMAENHAHGKMQNLDSEVHMKTIQGNCCIKII